MAHVCNTFAKYSCIDTELYVGIITVMCNIKFKIPIS